MDPIPFCTLTAGELDDRLAWIRAEILPHVRHMERLEGGVAWELADAPGLAEKIDRLIELERACCSSIVFARTASATPGGLRLEIRGIDPDAEIVRELRAPSGRAQST
jgi:hypothetical protein